MGWRPGKTPKRLAIWGGLLFVLLLGLLWVELVGCGEGDCITTNVQLVWAVQPWVVFLVVLVIGLPVVFLLGHFTAAPADTYRQLRGEGRFIVYRDLEDCLASYDAHRQAGRTVREAMDLAGLSERAALPRRKP